MPEPQDTKPGVEGRQVFFTGRVQGVGFRYTTQAVAQRHDVVGFVRNLPDGRVEVVAEGLSAELNRFIQNVERAMAGYIDDRTEAQTIPTGEFTSFSIRR